MSSACAVNMGVAPAAGPSASAVSRSTLDGEARISGLNLSFTSRPNSLIALGARMKYYDYDNRTASVTLTQRVGYDGSLSNLATMFRFNLLTYRDWWAWLDDPCGVPIREPSGEQLVLPI